MLFYTDSENLVLTLRVTNAEELDQVGITFDDPDLAVSYRLQEGIGWETPILVEGTIGEYLANSWIEIGDGLYQWCPPSEALVERTTTLIRVVFNGHSQYDTVELKLSVGTATVENQELIIEQISDGFSSILSAVSSIVGNVVVSVMEREVNGFPSSIRKGDARTIENGAAIFVRIYSSDDTEFTTPLLGSGSLLFADAETITFALTLVDASTPEVSFNCEWVQSDDDGYFLLTWDEDALDDATSFLRGSTVYHQWGIKVVWPTDSNDLTVAEGFTKVLPPIVN